MQIFEKKLVSETKYTMIPSKKGYYILFWKQSGEIVDLDTKKLDKINNGNRILSVMHSMINK